MFRIFSLLFVRILYTEPFCEQAFLPLPAMSFMLHEENTVFIYSMIYWIHKQYRKENTNEKLRFRNDECADLRRFDSHRHCLFPISIERDVSLVYDKNGT